MSLIRDTRHNSVHFWTTVCKTVRPMLSDRCLSCLSDLSVCNRWVDKDETWQAGRPRPRPHCVRWGPSSPEKGGTAPNFRLMSFVAKLLGGSRCHLVRRYRHRPRRQCVRWEPSSPEKRKAPHFRPMSVVAQRMGGPRCHLVRRWPRPRRHCVRWEPSSPYRKKHSSPHFSAHVYCGQTVARLIYC